MQFIVKNELKRFLDEDIGRGDITSSLLPKIKIKAKIIAQEKGVAAGVKFAKMIFELKNSRVSIKKKDGCKIKKNDTIMEIKGYAQAILACERTALNILSRMSGIATKTNEFKNKTTKYKTNIYATRKTAPGLRYFDKMAVKIGGGMPHRMTLSDMVMIKDNHLAIAGSLEEIISKAKKKYKKVEVEVENSEDAVKAAKAGSDIILFDNFSPTEITKTINLLKKNGLRRKVKIEASGGITSKNILKYAKTGVDIISVGEITNSVKAIDFSLEVY